MDLRAAGSEGQAGNAALTESAGQSRISVVFPTYGRESVLVDSVRSVLALAEPPFEVLLIDQTPAHESDTEAALSELTARGLIRWIRLEQPSITRAMNVGLLEARGDVVLFLDDDIIPQEGLVAAHRKAHDDTARPAHERVLVAGRVLQPWHLDGSRPIDRMASTEIGWVEEFMGGNFSVRRQDALALGGFDEHFVRVAYRFEAEFAHRARRAGWRFPFVPDATIHHLRSERGGTRSYGDHLRTALPGHAVGLYYFLLRTRPPGWWSQLIQGPFRAVATRFHLRHPWWIPAVMLAQLGGLAWAVILFAKGPALLGDDKAARA